MVAPLRRAFWAVKERERRLLDVVHAVRLLALRQRVALSALWHRATVELDVAPGVRIGRGVRMLIAPGTTTVIRIGSGTTIGDRVLFRLKGGRAEIGERCDLRRDAVISVGGVLELGGDNIVSWGVIIHCDEEVRIGRMTMAAEYATIVDSIHFHSEPDVPAHRNLRTAPVFIGDNVWICPKATITSGVRVGNFCIVSSNSMVTSDVPDGQVVSGVPAQVVRATRLPWVRPVAL